jgi:hypothetical protein
VAECQNLLLLCRIMVKTLREEHSESSRHRWEENIKMHV